MPGLVIQTIDPDQFAKKDEIPTAADETPAPVESSGRMGRLSKRFARADHTHATSVQKAKITLAAGGKQTWVFPTPYDAEPVVLLTPQRVTGLPVVVDIEDFVKDAAGKFTAVTVRGYRMQAMPASILGLSALNGFNAAGGAAPVGVVVNCYASAPTATPVP